MANASITMAFGHTSSVSATQAVFLSYKQCFHHKAAILPYREPFFNISSAFVVQEMLPP
jgi:hypothetical protein